MLIHPPFVDVTILITACKELNFADSLLLGTPSGVRDFETVPSQVCTEPSRRTAIFLFKTVNRQRRIGGVATTSRSPKNR